MSFDYRFRFLEDEKEIKELRGFLLSQTLNYPNYGDWVERAINEIDLGYKKTILAFNDDTIIGDLIFQPHKNLPKVIELKNMRIHPEFKRRYFGYFMLRQAEVESKNYKMIICDTRSDRIDVLNLLKLCGYKEVSRIPLYDSNAEDVIMSKTLNKKVS